MAPHPEQPAEDLRRLWRVGFPPTSVRGKSGLEPAVSFPARRRAAIPIASRGAAVSRFSTLSTWTMGDLPLASSGPTPQASLAGADTLSSSPPGLPVSSSHRWEDKPESLSYTRSQNEGRLDTKKQSYGAVLDYLL